MKNIDFKDIFIRVSSHVHLKYDIESSIGDVVDPNTGDFNGKTIMVDYLLSDEQKLFVLLHLVGHSIQWCINDELRELGLETIKNPTEEKLNQVKQYEKEATQYGIMVLHEVGCFELDQWASDLWLADWNLLKKLYLYGTDFSQDIKDLTIEHSDEKLTALEIPKFESKKFENRWSFNVSA